MSATVPPLQGHCQIGLRFEQTIAKADENYGGRQEQEKERNDLSESGLQEECELGVQLGVGDGDGRKTSLL